MKMKNRNQKKTNAGNRPDLRAQIETRAYDLGLADSCRDGNHLNHWLQAEREMVNMNES